MTKQTVSYQKAQISYIKIGEGDKTCFCFHGYSNDATIFEIFALLKLDQYTFIAIDLPYHGDTKWSRMVLTTQMLQEILALIIQKEKRGNTYSFLGFSLGGRVAISQFMYCPQRVEQLILLAPDGLYYPFVYQFVVRTKPGNWLMALCLKHANRTTKILEWAKKQHLINHKMYLNAKGFVSSKRERTLLFARWMTMKKLHPNILKFSKIVSQNRVPVTLVFGNADTIIPPQNANNLISEKNPNIKIQIWNAGHMLLREKYLQQLKKLFSSF